MLTIKEKLHIKRPYIIIGILVFLSMFIYYYIAHPLYIYDVDDWLYIGSVRHVWPSVNQWNPTKILPETMMPLISAIGAWVVYPITGDYIQALSWVYAVFTASIITCYFIMIAHVVKKVTDIQGWPLFLLIFVFFLLHFFLYLKNDSGNMHFFWVGNVNCIFNYLLSALWNFGCCLFFYKKKGICKQDKIIQNGLVIFVVYLAINSNLWHSIIFMSYVGAELLANLILKILDGKKNNTRLHWRIIREYVEENIFGLAAICVWLISMLFEINGSRAQWNVESGLKIKEAIKAFLYSLSEVRVEAWIALGALNIVCIIVLCKQIIKDRNVKAREFLVDQAKNSLCLGVTILYLILLAAKVSPAYLENSGVMISWMIWVLFISMLSAAYVIKTNEKVVAIMSLIAYMMIFETFVDRKDYAQNYASLQPPNVIKALDDDIINQVKIAEENGEDAVTVYIPVKGTGGWPISPSMIQTRISNALYYHGVTKKKMIISIVPDERKDAEFHIK